MLDDRAERPAPDLHLVRLTFETCTPLSVGSEEIRIETQGEAGAPAEKVTISAIARDANGLPTVPGPGLRGALRALAVEAYCPRFVNDIFGYEDSDGLGAAGRVVFGWSCVHDRSGEAVCGLLLDGLNPQDQVLAVLARPEPLLRDHVALNDRHAVDGRRKFARAAAPVGTRFSVELSGWGDPSFRADLLKTAGLLAHPRLRLGGCGTRGYGRIRLIAASYAMPDLEDADALRALRSQPPSRALATEVLDELAPPEAPDTVVTLSLSCADLLRIGAGGPHAKSLTRDVHRARRVDSGARLEAEALGAPAAAGEDTILKLLREPRIAWDGGFGRVIEITNEVAEVPVEQLRFPVPGSAVRGPLAHRMLFHANRAGGRCIDAESWLAEQDEARRAELEARFRGYAERDEDLAAFLGTAKAAAEPEGDGAAGRAARILFDDAEVRDVKWITALDHVSIDRFTGGARELTGALFREETLLGGRIEVRATIRPPLGPSQADGNVGGWPEATAKAFVLALRDLCCGRIALGGRSHGVCTGSVAFEGAAAVAWRAMAARADLPLAEPGP